MFKRELSQDIGLFESIQEETNRKSLVALALAVLGSVKAGLLEPQYYANCCVLLYGKLGFPITEGNLIREYEFYMKEKQKE